MIKTMTIKLKQLCSDCAIPSFSVNKEFIKIAESFGKVRKFCETNNMHQVYDINEAEEYLVSRLNVDVYFLQSLAILKQSEIELAFKKECEQTALFMCNDYTEHAKNILHRRKYLRCLASEQKRLEEIQNEIEILSKTVYEKKQYVESCDPNQKSSAMFIVFCREYQSIAAKIPDLIKNLAEVQNEAKLVIRHFIKWNDSLSSDWAEERFNDISGKIKNSYQKLSDQLLLLNEAENKATALTDQIFIKGSDPIVNGKSEKGSDGFGWSDNASWY